jgi:hypothetical protein
MNNDFIDKLRISLKNTGYLFKKSAYDLQLITSIEIKFKHKILSLRKWITFVKKKVSTLFRYNFDHLNSSAFYNFLILIILKKKILMIFANDL